jgi:hypothetical protein
VSTHEPMTAEARALHAILDGDSDEAERILRGFLPGELRVLQRACGELGALCGDIRRDPMHGIDADDSSTTTTPADVTADTTREERS